MRTMFIQLTAVAALSSAALAQSRVIITEIMYNPASNEKKGETEWVEIANVGSAAIEIKDWRLDDEDKSDWGKFSCTLAPGGVAVLINQTTKEEQFRAAWDAAPADGSAAAKPAYQIIPVKWGSLSNSPGPDNEIMQLRNDKDEVVCEVKQAGEWPTVKGVGGFSVYLADTSATNLSNGKLWKKAEAGKDGCRKCKTTETFDKEDCGSPGTLPGPSAAAPTPPATTKPAEPKPDAKPKGDKIDY